MPAEGDVIDGLTRALIRACRRLAEVGYPQESGRLVAEGWLAVRVRYPRRAQHLDGVMHHIARLERDFEATAQAERPEANLTKGMLMTDDPILDVRTEAPKRRHELIFETFGTLPSGASYVLVNDHDPKPLKYQFEAENAGEFSWEYLEEGPEVWRVRIGRVADTPAAA